MRIAFYACGGGFGHGARALGLARACRSLGLEGLLLAPRRLEPFALWAGIRHEAPPVEPPSGQELREWVVSVLGRFRPEVLVVDVFPRGVLGELREVLCALAPVRVLLTRHADPRFYQAPGMERALREYRLVLATEPPAPALEAHPGLRLVSPITLLEASELDPRPPRFEVLDLTGLAPDLARPPSVVPAAPVLRGAAVVVAHAGYASYYEILQAGVPAVLVPLPRPLDDQFARARGELGRPLRAPHEVVDRREEVQAALRRLAGARPVEPQDLGGARRAAEAIARLLG